MWLLIKHIGYLRIAAVVFVALSSLALVATFGEPIDIIPITALYVAGFAVFVAVCQTYISIRPWITIDNPSIDVTDSTERGGKVYTIQLPVVNTGSIPAKDIRVNTKIWGESQEPRQAPALAPNARFYIPYFLDTNIKITTLEVLIEYGSLGRNHESLQTYHIKWTEIHDLIPGKGYSSLTPTEPTHFK